MRRAALFVFAMLVVLCILYILTKCSYDVEYEKPSLRYYRIDADRPKWMQSLSPPKVFQEVFAEMGAQEAPGFQDANFILFKSLDFIDQTIHKLPYALGWLLPRPLTLFGIKGSDLLACKARSFMVLRDTLPESRLWAMVPRTWVLAELTARRESLPEGYYILKKNVQRQQGHMLLRTLGSAAEWERKGYVIAQELLQDPLMIQGRKINLRIYLLVIIRYGRVRFLIYRNGFLYYTPELFERHSLDPAKIITTGYIDRRVYDTHPMTLEDLQASMGRERYGQLFRNVVQLFRDLRHSFARRLATENVGLPGTKMLVYGCDVAPDAQLQVKLMEINKGPDLDYKDARDRRVKFYMVRDMMVEAGWWHPAHPSSNFLQI